MDRPEPDGYGGCMPATLIAGDRLPTLTGARVELRWLVPSDASALYAVFSDKDVMRYGSRPPFEDESEARELVAAIERAFAEQSLFQWGVARRDDHRVIGTCTLSHVDAPNLRAELGYALGRDHWGKGLMGEALALLLAFAFRELGLRRLEADVDPRNAASIRSLERLGFRREGYLRERWFVAGEVQDALLYGLLRREWEAGG
jgi:ribosomal-protein-alanine N-acetyltransferase